MKRNKRYDFFRCLCMMAVIINHVGDIYRIENNNCDLGANVWVGFSCFSVNGFLMLSGALLINGKSIVDLKGFYKKAIIRLGVPTLMFSAFYAFVSIIPIHIGSLHNDRISDIGQIMHQWITGWYGHPLWYMYMFSGIYLVAPFIQKVKDSISDRAFLLLCIGYLLWAILSSCFTVSKAVWSISTVFTYLSFFMIGGFVGNILKKKEWNFRVSSFASGILGGVCYY